MASYMKSIYKKYTTPSEPTPSKQWICSQCSFQNHSLLHKCEICAASLRNECQWKEQTPSGDNFEEEDANIKPRGCIVTNEQKTAEEEDPNQFHTEQEEGKQDVNIKPQVVDDYFGATSHSANDHINVTDDPSPVSGAPSSAKRAAENLQIVQIDGLECVCRFRLDQTQLYFCKYSQCHSEVYCNECGPFMHRSSLGKDHKFEDKISINELLQKDENTHQYTQGRKQLITLIGIANYNILASYKNKVSVAVCNAAGSSAVPIVNEIRQFIDSTKKAIKAMQAAGGASRAAANATKQASLAAKKIAEAQKAVQIYEDLLQDVELLNLMDNDSWNPVYKFCRWCYDRMGYESLDEVKQQASAALEHAGKLQVEAKVFEETAKNAENLKVVAATKADAAATTVQESISLENSLRNGAYIVSVLTALEVSYHAYRYAQGQISGKEWCRLSGKALCRNVGSLIGSSIGGQMGVFTASKIGATVGSSICPGFGTMAGVGVGLVSGMILGYYFGKNAEDIYESVFPAEEEAAKKRLIREALLYFRFSEQDIKNSHVFNERTLKKEFRICALKDHPDRNYGDHSRWNQLSIYYGVLKSLLEQTDSNKDMIRKTVYKQLNN